MSYESLIRRYKMYRQMAESEPAGSVWRLAYAEKAIEARDRARSIAS